MNEVSDTIRTLRARLARRQQEKAELERDISAVQSRYQEEVAPLKEEVLRRRTELLRQKAQKHMRSARHRNAYHDAQRSYETFREEWAENLSESVDLRPLYRQASKKCHPDMVAEPYRDEAAATFQALEGAYQAEHTAAVRSISEALERWGFPTERAEQVSDEDPTVELDHLRTAVSSLDAAIETLRSTDSYQSLSEAPDVETLIEAHKREFLRQLKQLKRYG